MSVRGSKNKILLYIAGVCSLLFVILLYHNASTRLEVMEKAYERCHLNEESLSAQLQVNLEYKIRLEKTLQQEKSDHSQIKEDLQKKLEEERQSRVRENQESIKKFTALQQQYKFLKSQHEDTNVEYGKMRQSYLSENEEKSRLEKTVQRLQDELKLLKENDIDKLKIEHDTLKVENDRLKADRILLVEKLKKYESVGSQIKLPDTLPLNSSLHMQNPEKSENILQQPDLVNKLGASVKSSTAANKADQEFLPSGNNVYVNTSTPMINPDAVNSQDKMLNAVPVPQPKQETFQSFVNYDNKENVGAKPEDLSKAKNEAPVQGVLRSPDILKDFDHIPEIREYKEKLKQGNDRNNNGGEVGDEGEPLMRNENANDRHMREGDIEGVPFIRHPAGNEIPKNQIYQYHAEYDGRKEENEDDDDADPLDYHNAMEKNQPQEHQEKANLENIINIPFQDKRESVMIQPK